MIVGIATLIVTDVRKQDEDGSEIAFPGLCHPYHYFCTQEAVDAITNNDLSLYEFLHSDSGNGVLWEDALQCVVGNIDLMEYLKENADNLNLQFQTSEIAPEGVYMILMPEGFIEF